MTDLNLLYISEEIQTWTYPGMLQWT